MNITCFEKDFDFEFNDNFTVIENTIIKYTLGLLNNNLTGNKQLSDKLVTTALLAVKEHALKHFRRFSLNVPDKHLSTPLRIFNVYLTLFSYSSDMNIKEYEQYAQQVVTLLSCDDASFKKSLHESICDKFSFHREPRAQAGGWLNSLFGTGEISERLKTLAEQLPSDKTEIKNLISETLGDIVKQSSFKEFAFTTMLQGSLMLIFVCTSIHGIVNKDAVSIAISIGIGIGLLLLSSEEAYVVVSNIFNYFKNAGVQAQSASDYATKIIPLIFTSLAAALGYHAGIKKDNMAKDSVNFMMYADKVMKAKNSFIDIFNIISDFVVDIIEMVRYKLYGFSKKNFFSTGNSDLDEFIHTAGSILESVDKGTLAITPTNFNIIRNLITQGEVLYTKTVKDPNLKKGNHVLLRWLTALNKVKEKFVGINPAVEGFRMEPVGVLLNGGPGLGKSNLINYLVHDIMPHILEDAEKPMYEERPACFYHVRQSEHEYWDGFDPKTKILIFDDFGQSVSVPGSGDSEEMNIIRAINGFPHCLHMADMATKGKVFNRSEIVIATTNLSKISANCVNSVDALKRRFNLSFYVYPRDEYCTADTVNNDVMSKKLDYNKLPIEGGKRRLIPDVLLFQRYDPIFLSYIGKPMTKDEVVQLILVTREVHQERFAYLMDKLQGKVEAQAGSWITHLEDLIEAKGRTDGAELFEFEVFVEEKISAILEAYKQASADEIAKVSKKLVILERYLKKSNVYLCLNHFDLLRRFLICADSETLRKFLFSEDMQFIRNDGILARDMKERIEYLRAISPLGDRLLEDKTILQQMRDSIFSMLSRVGGNIIKFVDFCKTNPWLLLGISAVMSYIYRDALFRSTSSMLLRWVFPSEFNRLKELAGSFQKLSTPEDKKLFLKNYSYTDLKYVYYSGMIEDDVLHDFIRKAELQEPGVLAQALGYEPQQQQVKKISNAAKIKSILKSQAGFDHNANDILQSVLKKNTFELYYAQNEHGDFSRIGQVLGIVDNYAIAPNHFVSKALSAVQDNPSVLDYLVRFVRSDARRPEGAYYREVSMREYMSFVVEWEFEDRDLVLLRLDRKFQPFRDIRSMLVKDQFLNDINNYPISLGLVREGNLHFYNSRTRLVTRQVQVQTSGVDETHVLGMCLEYPIATRDGDCGGVVVLNNLRTAGKIVALHVAGDTGAGFGYGAILTYDMIEKYLPSEEKLIKEDLTIDDSGDLTIPANFGMESKGILVSQAGHTNIRKSRIVLPDFKRLTAPARLRDFKDSKGDLIRVFDQALSKYCKGDKFINPRVLDVLTDSVYTFLVRKSKPYYKAPSPLSYHQACFGFDSCDYQLNPINKTTSMGYPYNSVSPPLNVKKNDIFKMAPDGSFYLNRSFERYLERIVEKLMKGERHTFIYTDCLKDERRPIPKVLKGKTRLFSAACIEYLIIFRKYFGDFMAWINHNKLDNWSAIEVNPYGNDWNKLYMKLSQFGETNSGGDGDYASYDGTQKSAIHWRILDIINMWYDDGEENQFVRRMLWLEITDSKHIKGDTIYIWSDSNPSGNPATTHINIIYNMFCFHYAFYHAVNYNKKMLYNIDQYMYCCFMGDDNIWSVAPILRNVFTEKYLHTFMNDYLGMEYTSADKGEPKEHLRDIKELSFLKRGFRYCDVLNRWVAPLDLQTVLEIPLWTKKGTDSDTIVLTNVDVCLKELSLHGRPIFEKYSADLRRSLLESYNLAATYVTFTQTLEEVVG